MGGSSRYSACLTSAHSGSATEDPGGPGPTAETLMLLPPSGQPEQGVAHESASCCPSPPWVLGFATLGSGQATVEKRTHMASA